MLITDFKEAFSFIDQKKGMDGLQEINQMMIDERKSIERN
jgi:hypothetical protein